MDSYAIIVIIFGILTLGVLILLFFINRLNILKSKIISNYKNIYNYLTIRADIIREAIDYIKNNLEHEQHLIKKLENAIETIKNSKNLENNLKEVKKTKDILKKFLELEKTYSFLKKEKRFLELKERALVNEDRIEYSTESYDKGVKNYNDYKEKGLLKIISKLFNFKKYDYCNK